MSTFLRVALYVFAFGGFSFSAFAQDCASLLPGGKDYVLVLLIPRANRPKLDSAEAVKIQAGHLANIGRLAKEGFLQTAGPNASGGGGIFIFHAMPVPKIDSLLQTDPAIAIGRFDLDVHPIKLVYGSLCTPEEPYELMTYVRVHITRASPTRWTRGEEEKAIYAEHRAYMDSLAKTGLVLADADYGYCSGGDVIFKCSTVEEAKAALKEHPLLKSEFLLADYREWMTAKGAFCEK